MNLIQIQDRLKSLPNDPRVMQMLTAYANGQNPQVPPYLALGELNRRKVLMERAQMEKAGQPPQGTVKDQVEQQAGVMALQQGRQQQAMQRMAQQGGIAGPVPQNIPQPEAQAEPAEMAAGGLASLRPKGYRSGGIIAFQEAGSVDDALEKDEEEKKEEAALPADPKALMARLMQEVAQRRNIAAPTAETPLEARARMIKENPDRYGILNTPVGADALSRLEELQGARRAELAKQREELAGAKPGILQLLGQAAMGTRGQKGGSALASILGGYSELASGAEAKQLQQEQALRMKELDLQQARAEAMNKVDDLRRAQAEGDIAGEQKAKMDLARIAKDHNVSINTLLGKQLATAGTLVESARRAEDTQKNIKSREDIAAERRKLEERLERLRANRPGEKERILQRVEQLRKDGKNEEADQLMSDVRYMQGGGSDVGRARNERVIITDLIRSLRQDLKDVVSPEEEAEIKAQISDLTRQLKGLLPKSGASESGPKPITGAEFDAKWKTLKKGETLVGPDGKTYTKG